MSQRILESTRDKALRVAALLSSDKAGEVAAAVSALDRLLPAGLSVLDIVTDAIEALEVSMPAVTPLRPVDLRSMPSGGWLRCPWVAKARACLDFSDRFQAAEIAFLGGMITRAQPPSEKQAAWLDRLHATLREAA